MNRPSEPRAAGATSSLFSGQEAAEAAFGPFQLDLGSGDLRRDGELVRLRPLATRALVLLVRRRGELVSLQDLRRELWGGTAVAWRTGLHQTIRQVRGALGDVDRRLVETVPRRGYRFVGASAEAAAAEDTAPPMEPTASRRIWSRMRLRGAGMYAAGVATPLALIALLILACLLLADAGS